ncbi:MAG: hypothetical protein HC800_17065 [Phormidesmis sp. RL_2_1]|nr:hypothetical protein [Phormidesmis sp. RL_2_1]
MNHPQFHDGLSKRPTDGTERSKILPRLLDVGIVLILLLATVAINLRMIRYGLNGIGDSRWHLTWLQHFSKQLFEGIVYPRWLAGTNFGYGSPTFVFYPPLVYYLGAGLKALGLTFEQMVNTLFSGAIFFSGISFFIFGRSYWGRFPSLVGALAYMLSPGIMYLTNGGGLAGLYSFVWSPLILYFTHRSIYWPGDRLSGDRLTGGHWPGGHWPAIALD